MTFPVIEDWVLQRGGLDKDSRTLRQRLLEVGAAALTDSELLTLLFGEKGRARSVESWAEGLLAAGGDLKSFALKDPQELCRLPGLGNRRAAQVLCALELGRRVQRAQEPRPRLRTPKEIYRYLAPQFLGLRREEFRVLCFNSRNTLLGNLRVAEGTVDSCPVDPREVFAPAVSHRATAIVVAHNHPSGDPEPSSQDLALTAQLVEAGRILGIRVLDHLVVGATSFVSLLEQGRMPSSKRSFNALFSH